MKHILYIIRSKTKLTKLTMPYTKCPTCNNLIGHVHVIMKEMRAIKNQNTNSDKNMIDIFEILGITNYCCKTRLISCREFNEYLHE